VTAYEIEAGLFVELDDVQLAAVRARAARQARKASLVAITGWSDINAFGKPQARIRWPSFMINTTSRIGVAA